MRRVLWITLLVVVLFSGIIFAVQFIPKDPLESKLERFFGSSDYKVIIQRDINRDKLEEIVAVKNSKRDRDGITKAIVLQNDGEKYPTLMEVTLEGVWGKGKKVILPPDDFNQEDISSWRLTPYEYYDASGFKLQLTLKDGYTTEGIDIRWDEERHEYLWLKIP